ncbi:MAG: DUF1289 domain-containing protein [Burkholderiales bacterium]
MSPPTVPSPCIGLCRLDPVTGWCQGCLRTIEEIQAWPELNSAQKLQIWQLLRQRRLSSP